MRSRIPSILAVLLFTACTVRALPYELPGEEAAAVEFLASVVDLEVRYLGTRQAFRRTRGAVSEMAAVHEGLRRALIAAGAHQPLLNRIMRGVGVEMSETGHDFAARLVARARALGPEAVHSLVEVAQDAATYFRVGGVAGPWRSLGQVARSGAPEPVLPANFSFATAPPPPTIEALLPAFWLHRKLPSELGPLPPKLRALDRTRLIHLAEYSLREAGPGGHRWPPLRPGSELHGADLAWLQLFAAYALRETGPPQGDQLARLADEVLRSAS